MIIESWSSWKAKSMTRLPEGIQVQSRWTNGSSSPAPRIRRKSASATAKAPISTAGPISETAALARGQRMAMSPLARKPASGRATVSQSSGSGPSAAAPAACAADARSGSVISP